MKKTLLFAFVAAGLGLSGQGYKMIEQNEHRVPVENFTKQKPEKLSIKSLSASSTETYSFYDAMSGFGLTDGPYISTIFPDTSTFIRTSNGGDDFRPFTHMAGQVFDPTSDYYDIGSNTTSLNAEYTYNLESISLVYSYQRIQNNNDDTLVVYFYNSSDLLEGQFTSSTSFFSPEYDHQSNECLNPTHVEKIVLNGSHETQNFSTIDIPVSGIDNINGDEPIAVVVKYMPGNPYSTDDYLYNGTEGDINHFSMLTFDVTSDYDSHNYAQVLIPSVRYDENQSGWNGRLIPGNAYPNTQNYAIDFEISHQLKISSVDLNLTDTIICAPGTVTPSIADMNSFQSLNWEISGPENYTSSANSPTFNLGTSGSYTLSLSAVTNGGTTIDTTWTNIITAETFNVDYLNGSSQVVYTNDDPVQIPEASVAGGTFQGTGVMSGYFYPNNAGVGTHNITYTVTNSIGCSGSATYTFHVLDSDTSNTNNNAPIASFTLNTNTICEGESITFTDNSAYSPSTWSWSFTGNNGQQINSSEINPTITFNVAGTYSVELTVTNNYGSDSESITGNITVKESPSVSFDEDTVNYDLNGGTFSLPLVSFSGGTLSYTSSVLNTQGELNNDVEVGTYSVTGIVDNGDCTSEDSFELNVFDSSEEEEGDTTTTAVNDLNDLESFVIFPNPASNQFQVGLPNNIKSAQIEILSMTGSVVYSKSNINSNTSINVSHLANGVYFIKIIYGKEAEVKRFVKK